MLRSRLDTGTVAIVLVFAALAVLVVCRLWLAIEIPLMDTTESRYGEMARKMVETGNWLMPQHDYGVPYLAKPPLAIWLSAGGIALLGSTELGPRLPILLVAVAFLVFLHRWLTTELGPRSASAGVLILTSSALFFAAAGAVMTDLVLVACTSFALLAFWKRLRGAGRGSEYALFVALGLGFLTKGPLAAVLVLGPIAIWALLCGRTRETWHRIGWVRGALTASVVAVPWYLAAEWRYPDFLSYFLLGENIQRFLVSDWQGDLYGPVHEVPHGTIWVYLLIAALPWSFIAPVLLTQRRRAAMRNWSHRRELALLLATATAVPMLLFTLASNVIAPYVLPALIPLVILVVLLLGEESMTPRLLAGVAATAGSTALALVVGASLLEPRIAHESERELVTAADQSVPTPPEHVYYWRHRYYSGDYYSHGRADVLWDTAELQTALGAETPFALAIPDEQVAALPAEVTHSLDFVGEYSKKALFEFRPTDSGNSRGGRL